MAYANTTDVEDVLPEDEELPEAGTRGDRNLRAALEEATDLVIGFLGRTFTDVTDTDDDDVPDDVPGAVRRVVARVAMRCFIDEPSNPGAESETQLMGPFSYALNWSKESYSRSVYLTDADELRLKPYIRGNTGGARHAPMVGANECYG